MDFLVRFRKDASLLDQVGIANEFREFLGRQVGVVSVAWWYPGSARARRPRPVHPCSMRPRLLKVLAFGGLIALAAVWWMAPRMSLDGSILNRPKIWLAGLWLFAVNPDGVVRGAGVSAD